MEILVVGSNGQLGRDMVALAKEHGHSVSGLDIPDIDITSPASVDKAFLAYTPDVVLNCAAYTAVDACEENKDTAFSVNREGVAQLAKASKKYGARLLHVSTDYVFPGANASPYVETDPTGPASVYGQSKLAGEQVLQEILPEHWIVRLAWLYGMHGKNFVKTIRRVAAQRAVSGEGLRVVNDQVGTPTYTCDVCRQILKLIETNDYGIFHCTNEGQCSWYDFAQTIIDTAGIDVDLQPCATSEYPLPAPRPAYSVLENKRLKDLGIHTMPHWREGFAGFLADEQGARTTGF